MSKMMFISVSEFKTRYGISSSIEVVESPSTSKWFVSTQVGNFKCEVGLDTDKVVKYMYSSEEAFEEGCFVNVDNSKNVRGTL